MKSLSEFKKNLLYIDVVDEILEDSKDYDGKTLKEKVLSRLKDLAHGLANGHVGRLIYYDDTTAFYQKFKTEINGLLYETLENVCLSITELFGEDWDITDPLALDIHNQNLLAWFAYEEIANQLNDYLEE